MSSNSEGTTLNLYCVTETDQKHSNINTTHLVVAGGFEEAARLFVLAKRYLHNDVEIVAQGVQSLLFVTPASALLDATGVVDWDPKAAQFVGFDRDWLREETDGR